MSDNHNYLSFINKPKITTNGKDPFFDSETTFSLDDEKINQLESQPVAVEKYLDSLQIAMLVISFVVFLLTLYLYLQPNTKEITLAALVYAFSKNTPEEQYEILNTLSQHSKNMAANN